VAVLALLAGCSGASPTPVPVPVPTHEPSIFPFPSPSRAPVVTTDGCQGLVTAAQVGQAVGKALQPTAGDGAGAATQYAHSVASLGLTATVRVCPFGDAAGDQVTVVALAFPDAEQATKLFATAQGVGPLTPVSGFGDAAVSNHANALVGRRGKTVVAVYLVLSGVSGGDHTGTLRALAALVKS
jgi:hypothetical protein